VFNATDIHYTVYYAMIFLHSPFFN